MNSFSLPAVPADTRRAAAAAFGRANLYLIIGDRQSELFLDVEPEYLSPSGDFPAILDPLLTLVTLFQFAEDLPDRQAVESVRVRTDWKYALHLPMLYPDLRPAALCHFRARLAQNECSQQMFGRVFGRLTRVCPLVHGGKESASVPEILDSICMLTRLDCMRGTLYDALSALAVHHPDWLRQVARPHWYERYSTAASAHHLPREQAQRQALALEIGRDAKYLLEATAATSNDQPDQVWELRALRQYWLLHYETQDGDLRWRACGAFSCTVLNGSGTAVPCGTI